MKQESKENKEVAKAQTTALAEQLPQNSWGSEGIDKTDILIPKLLIMQGLSEFVADRKASIGDIVRSTTGEILADGKKNEGVEFIPLMTFKTWVKEEKVGSKFEYRGQEPMTAANQNDPWTWEENGTEWRRNKSLNFYVLLPQDIEKDAAARKKIIETGEIPDTDDVLLPCVLSFRRTSYSAGMTLSTHFIKARDFGVPPAASIFKLTSKSEKNDQGNFQVAEVVKVGKTNPEWLKPGVGVCHRWYTTLATSNASIRVDESDERGDLGGDGKPVSVTKVNVNSPEAQF